MLLLICSLVSLLFNIVFDFFLLKTEPMTTKLFVFIACTFIIISCGDNASTSEQNKEEQTEQSLSQEAVKQQAQEPEPLLEIDFETAKNFIPEGFQIVSYNEEANFLAGNFDGDNAQDFAVIVSSVEAEFFQDAEDVRILIFEQQSDNTFKKVAESGNLDGYFIHNAETSQLHLNKNVISIKRQDMRFDNEWKFRYEEVYDDYALIGSEYNNYGNAAGDGSGNRSINYLTGKKIEKFNEWDMKSEKLNQLPVETTKVNSVKQKPVLLKNLNAESFYDL